MNKKAVAKRLKQSKRNKYMFDWGAELGREWAEQRAEAHEIERLLLSLKSDRTTLDRIAFRLGKDVDDVVELTDHEMRESWHFGNGFKAGVLAVFNEHKAIFTK